MTSRTYRYRQWLKYLKSEEYELFEKYCYRLQRDAAIDSILNNLTPDLEKMKEELSQEIKDSMYGFDTSKSGKPVTFLLKPEHHL